MSKRMKMFPHLIRYLVAALLVAAVAGCSPPPLQTDGKESGRIEITPLKSYIAAQSNALLWLAGVNGVSAENSIDCYRVVYPSTDEEGKPIRLSGLLALPHGLPVRGLVSWQHGTSSSRDYVPSNLSTDGLAAAIVFAGNGYAAIAPDYDGMGVSTTRHEYFVASETARTVVDMIHAVRHIRGVPASPPFLIGFSEGGFASLAAQRAMEAAGEPVLADAAISGVYNLRTISVPWVLKGTSVNSSTYLALWIRGYATRYGHPLDSAFTPEYAALVPTLFDRPHEVDVIIKALPHDPRKLLAPTVLDALGGKGDSWLVNALSQNAMGDWAAMAPIRMYYATDDADITPQDTMTAARQMAARGSNIQVVNVGNGDHSASILKAAPLALRWLQAFPDAQPPR